MRISVMVPTYKRSKDLANCLKGLQLQARPADQVMVIVRDTDTETREFFKTFAPANLALQIVDVHEPGHVQALNAGLAQATGDVLAVTDDDAVPPPDWLLTIEKYYQSDPELVGLGGRDRVHFDGKEIEAFHPTVGKLQWWGRVISNHHIGIGPPRPVEELKCVNSSYRTKELREIGYDARLRGAGAQIHMELSLGLKMRARGYKIIYDPQLVVDHYPADRQDRDHRELFNAEALSDRVYNQTFVLLEHLPPLRRTIFLLWAFLVGDREGYGIVQWLRFLPTQGAESGQRLAASWSGRKDAIKDWQQNSAPVKS